jgi:hypothetical protein
MCFFGFKPHSPCGCRTACPRTGHKFFIHAIHNGARIIISAPDSPIYPGSPFGPDPYLPLGFKLQIIAVIDRKNFVSRPEFFIRKLFSAFLVILLLTSLNEVFAQSFYIVSLGLTDGTDLTAAGMNNKGEVAGLYNRPSDNYFSGGWLWLPEADFGYPSGHSFIPPSTSGDNAQLEFSGINDSGLVAGTMNDFNDGGEGEVNQHLITWESGSFNTELTGRPSTTNTAGIFNPSARQVNNLGRFIATSMFARAARIAPMG